MTRVAAGPADIASIALQVWGDEAKAHAFLKAPHPRLAGLTPTEAATTEAGIVQIEAILSAIEYGLPV